MINKTVVRYNLHIYQCQLLSCVQLFATPWTIAHQAPLSMEFSRQEYWNGLPFPPPGDLPDPGVEPRSLALQTDSLLSEPPGKHTSIRLTKIKKTNPTKYRQIYGGSGMFMHCREECKLLQPFQKLQSNVYLQLDPAIPLLDNCSGEIKALCPYKTLHIKCSWQLYF